MFLRSYDSSGTVVNGLTRYDADCRGLPQDAEKAYSWSSLHAGAPYRALKYFTCGLIRCPADGNEAPINPGTLQVRCPGRRTYVAPHARRDL